MQEKLSKIIQETKLEIETATSLYIYIKIQSKKNKYILKEKSQKMQFDHYLNKTIF